MNKLSLKEQLFFSTTRIEAYSDNGSVGYGTGFFYNLLKENGDIIPLLITNYHVISGMTNFTFYFTKKDDKEMPVFDHHIQVSTIPLNSWKRHPDAAIDLCALPILPIIKKLYSEGLKPYYRTMENKYIPSQEQWNAMDAIEKVLMIGYPDAIWDKRNNMPIARQGITASVPYLNFNGKDIFLIDAAVYNGSSGSPVYLLEDGVSCDKNGNVKLGGTRFFFLGVVCQTFLHEVNGELKLIPVPISKTNVVPTTKIPNNLGVVIKSSKILDFDKIF